MDDGNDDYDNDDGDSWTMIKKYKLDDCDGCDERLILLYQRCKISLLHHFQWYTLVYMASLVIKQEVVILSPL